MDLAYYSNLNFPLTFYSLQEQQQHTHTSWGGWGGGQKGPQLFLRHEKRQKVCLGRERMPLTPFSMGISFHKEERKEGVSLTFKLTWTRKWTDCMFFLPSLTLASILLPSLFPFGSFWEKGSTFYSFLCKAPHTPFVLHKIGMTMQYFPSDPIWHQLNRDWKIRWKGTLCSNNSAFPSPWFAFSPLQGAWLKGAANTSIPLRTCGMQYHNRLQVI